MHDPPLKPTLSAGDSHMPLSLAVQEARLISSIIPVAVERGTLPANMLKANLKLEILLFILSGRDSESMVNLSLKSFKCV